MDERQWIWAIQHGNKKYLQDIAEKYYDDIFRFCAFQSGSVQNAYDLAQETFLRFIRYVEGYRHRNLKGYLLTIAMNVCRNYHRKNYGFLEESMSLEKDAVEQGGLAAEGMAEADPAAREPEDIALSREETLSLMKALGTLSDVQREAILLYYFYDMKYREIGRLTGVGVATVKSRVRQGLAKLRSQLRREDFYR